MQAICEKCSKINLPDAKACIFCGHPMPEPDATAALGAPAVAAAPSLLASRFNTCPGCATVNVANASVCRACGHQLQAPASAAAFDSDATLPPLAHAQLKASSEKAAAADAGAAEVAAPTRQKSPLWIALGAGALLAVAAVAIWVLSSNPSRDEVPAVKPNPFAIPAQPAPVVEQNSSATASPPLAVPAQDAAATLPSDATLSATPPTPMAEAGTTPAPSQRPVTQKPTVVITESASGKLLDITEKPAPKRDAKADQPRNAASASAPVRNPTAAAREGAAAKAAAAPAPAAASADNNAPSPASQATAADSPQEACADRSFIIRPICIQQQCNQARFTNHAQCVKLRAQQQETQQRMQERN